jgi:thiol-disulfide isomerase/thioredoxin
MKLKKIFLSILLILLATNLLWGCAQKQGTSNADKNSYNSGAGAAKENISTAFKNFAATDLNGNRIDRSVFKDHKLTMVNLWGTFCSPCIAEMQDFADLEKMLANIDVGLVGIVVDTGEGENIDTAKEIVKSTGVKYHNIIPDKVLSNDLLNEYTAVPTTFFVDAKGNIIGDPIIGASANQDYVKAAQTALKGLESK